MLPDPDFIDVSTMDENFEEDTENDVEIAEEVFEDEGVPARRGKDVEWEELEVFRNNQELLDSDVQAEIKEFMTKRKEWKTGWAINQNFSCKYQNKKGFKSCPKQFKVCFVSTCHQIAVFSNTEEHCHQEDLDHVTAVNYHWTGPQQEVVVNCIKFGGKNNNKIILEQLRAKGLCNGSGKFPTCAQVGTKKRNMKKAMKKYGSLVTTADLISLCEKKNKVPEDDDEAYVVFYHPKSVNEEEEDDEGRQIFTIIWSTPRMLRRLTIRSIGQNDATYKLSWFDWPCFISGVSSMTGRYFLGLISYFSYLDPPLFRYFMTHMSLTSHENTASWVKQFAFVKSIIGEAPR